MAPAHTLLAAFSTGASRGSSCHLHTYSYCLNEGALLILCTPLTLQPHEQAGHHKHADMPYTTCCILRDCTGWTACHPMAAWGTTSETA